MSLATDVGAGVATGGLYNVAQALRGGGGSTSQVPLETPEQHAARLMLLQFAQTGKFGAFTAGASVPLGYGDYTPTSQETTGLSSLQDLLKNGIPSQYKTADDSLQQFLGANQGGIAAQFNPFQAQVQRQTDAAQAALKRGAGFAGDLYSTDTIKGLGDIQAQAGSTLSARLADLTNSALNRQLQAVPLEAGLGTSMQNAAIQRVGASQQYGDLTRSLNDQQIKARDAELLRQRQELQMPIQAAESISGASTPWGVPSVPNPSPYMQLLNTAGKIGGTALGYSLAGPVGGYAGGQLGSSLTSTADLAYAPQSAGNSLGGWYGA